MKKSNLTRLLRTVGTLLAFALLIILLSQQGWNEVWAGIQQIPLESFLIALLLMAISRIAVAARWYTLLRSTSLPISLRQSLRITFAGLFASNFLPTTIGGDVVRLTMSLRLGLDKIVVAASLVVDRLVGMAGMATALPFAAIDLDALARAEPLGRDIAVAVWSRKIFDRSRKIARQLVEALAIWVRTPRTLLLAFGLTWVHQICIFTITWMFLTGMQEEISLGQVGGLWSLSYFVTLLPISINGLGVQELSITVLFSNLAGVSLQGAATAALLVRTLQTLASVPGMIFLPDILAQTDRGKRETDGI